MYLLAKYNTQTDFYFPVVKRGVVDLAVTADWTPATGDTKVSKDGGAVANTTNNPAIASGVSWKLTITNTELSCKWLTVQIIDSATKAIEDQFLTILTYGNASAFFIAPDYQDVVRFGLTALPNAAAEAAGGLYTRGTGAGQINQPANGSIDSYQKGLIGTALTEGAAGRLKAALTTLLDVAAPVLTVASVNQTGDSFARIGAPVGASISADVAGVQSDTDNIQTRIPAALVSGRIDASVGAMASAVITNAAIAADTGLKPIRSNTAQAGAATTITLDASADANNNFYNNALILLTGGTGAGQARFISAYNGTTKVATVATWVTNPDNTTTFAILPFDAVAGASAPTTAQIATAVWQDLLAGSDFGTAASIGKLLKDDIDAAISTRSTQTSVDTIDDFIDTEVGAIKTKTDQLTFTTTNKVDSTIQAAGDFAQGAADKVWSTAARTLTAFDVAFKTGYALSSAGIQAIWDALTSALTTVGSIGKLIVDNLNATISSRASQTSLDTLDDFVDTEVAAIKAVTDQFVFSVVGRVDSQVIGLANNSVTAASIAADAGTELATALLDLTNGIETSVTPRQALRIALAALAGKLSGANTTTVTIRNVGDSKDRITATVDADGNRSAVTTDGT